MALTTQVTLLLAIVIFIAGLILIVAFLDQKYRKYSKGSASFTTANAATNLAIKFDAIVTKDSRVYIPAGQGRYPMCVPVNRRNGWEQRLGNWLHRGANITFLITSPNEEARQYWGGVAARLPKGLQVVILDSHAAAAADATEIVRLDRFHPSLVLDGPSGTPLGMWIEGDHPPDSDRAYNVSYVAGADIIQSDRTRFDRYLRVIEQLIGDGSETEFRKVIRSTNQNQETAHAA